jgi:hypothetical protein
VNAEITSEIAHIDGGQSPGHERAPWPVQAGSRVRIWLFWRMTCRHFRSSSRNEYFIRAHIYA